MLYAREKADENDAAKSRQTPCRSRFALLIGRARHYDTCDTILVLHAFVTGRQKG